MIEPIEAAGTVFFADERGTNTVPIPPKGGSDAETIILVNAFGPLSSNRIFTARNSFPAVFIATASRGQARGGAAIRRKVSVIPVPDAIAACEPRRIYSGEVFGLRFFFGRVDRLRHIGRMTKPMYVAGGVPM